MDRVELRKALSERFSPDELRELCFDLGISYEDLPGGSKGAKAVEIVSHFERSGRTGELVVALRNLRPNLGLQQDETEIEFYNYLRKPIIESIDNDKRRRNLSKGNRVCDELIRTLLSNGWIRFAAGFKAGLYAHQENGWCIKILGMGVGDDPSYFCERGYYLEHERNLLMDFKDAGFSFQPNVMTQEDAISFLVTECGVNEERAIAHSKNNDLLITEFLPGIPLLTQIGRSLDCEIDPRITNDRALRDIGIALEILKTQLDDANAQGLLHNDPIGFNIVFTQGTEDKIAAKLVDFELAQNLSKQSPDYVNNSVEELYRLRNVPYNPQSRKYTNNLDQHLMRESIEIVEQLSAKLKKLRDSDSIFHSVSTIGPFSSGIEVNLKNVILHLRRNTDSESRRLAKE